MNGKKIHLIECKIEKMIKEMVDRKHREILKRVKEAETSLR